MRIDPHLQVEVVESGDEVVTAHVTLTRPESSFVYLDYYEDRSPSTSRSSRKRRRGNYCTCNSN